MFLRISDKILNTDNLVDADVYEPGDSLSPHREGHAEERTVVITTVAMETGQDGTPAPYKIVLEGDNADLFLEALPVYAPVMEGERS